MCLPCLMEKLAIFPFPVCPILLEVFRDKKTCSETNAFYHTLPMVSDAQIKINIPFQAQLYNLMLGNINFRNPEFKRKWHLAIYQKF